MSFGKVGKALIQEMANLFQAYGENSSLECIALKACLLMQVLLLQKLSKTSKAKRQCHLFTEASRELEEGGNLSPGGGGPVHSISSPLHRHSNDS